MIAILLYLGACALLGIVSAALAPDDEIPTPRR